ncbi:terminase small subunit [Dietzia natronolimnaea]|uniref:terminase small subunit n=1 Tax=Dietzia natronolimnaea TaxID=161920 RepID=UPI0015F88A13|nr:terminase small subunit [Dietzia natronolimnaea]MBB1037389.1 hypothetical protein [Dietzia natronolimnaea]
MAESSNASEKHAGGRPLKFQTVDELDLAIQNYFAEQDPHTTKALVESGRDAKGNMLFDTRTVLTEQKPYTMTGLARALGVDRRTLLNYKNKDEFFPSIQGALNRCAEYAETQLFGPYANGAKFALINNYNGKYQDWSDKQAIDHTSDGKRIESPAIYMSKIEPRDGDAPAETEAS